MCWKSDVLNRLNAASIVGLLVLLVSVLPSLRCAAKVVTSESVGESTSVVVPDSTDAGNGTNGNKAGMDLVGGDGDDTAAGSLVAGAGAGSGAAGAGVGAVDGQMLETSTVMFTGRLPEEATNVNRSANASALLVLPPPLGPKLSMCLKPIVPPVVFAGTL